MCVLISFYLTYVNIVFSLLWVAKLNDLSFERHSQSVYLVCLFAILTYSCFVLRERILVLIGTIF